MREILSHKKVDVAAWVEIITTAHSLGVPTTSTIMYGHLESPRHVVNHLNLLRGIQKRTHGFTEFVPLRFIHENTVLFRKGLVTPPAHRLARLADVRHSRASFCAAISTTCRPRGSSSGVDLAAITLKAGCNDFSGTLMEESITAQAGGTAGEFRPGRSDRGESARDRAASPVERSTTYHKLYGRKAPNGARPITHFPQAHDHYACGGSGGR